MAQLWLSQVPDCLFYHNGEKDGSDKDRMCKAYLEHGIPCTACEEYNARQFKDEKQPAFWERRSSAVRTRALSKKQRHASPSMLDIIQIKSVAENRSQLKSRFLDLFLSKEAGGPFHEQFGFVESSYQNEFALTAAVDALCVLQLGISFQDADLLLQYRTLYGRALWSIQRQLSTSTVAKDSVLGAVSVVGLCEYINSKRHDDSAYMTHVEGLLAMFKARGARSIQAGPRRRFFLRTTVLMALRTGLVSRKALVFEQPSWVAAAGEDFNLFTRNAMRASGALERCDTLLEAGDAPKKAIRLVIEILRLKAGLHAGLEDWCAAANEAPYHVVCTSAFADFNDLCGDLAGVFPTAYRFSSFMAAVVHTQYWNSLLVLDQAILDLHHAYDYAFIDSTLQRKVIEREASNCADDLCQAIPFFSQADLNTVGTVEVLGPLHFAQQFYEQRNAEMQVAWCKRVEEGKVLGHRIARVLAGESDSKEEDDPTEKWLCWDSSAELGFDQQPTP